MYRISRYIPSSTFHGFGTTFRPLQFTQKIGHFWQFWPRLGTLGKFPKKAILNFFKTRSFLTVTFFAETIVQRWLLIWYMPTRILALSDIARFWLFICYRQNQPFSLILTYLTHENIERMHGDYCYRRKFAAAGCIFSFVLLVPRAKANKD